ncbi:MAG: hypothetical protein NT062_11290 [Proteobacteria bacterium]|nr:hypothetical protein [Pseudomonadota bacterium]
MTEASNIQIATLICVGITAVVAVAGFLITTVVRGRRSERRAAAAEARSIAAEARADAAEARAHAAEDHAWEERVFETRLSAFVDEVRDLLCGDSVEGIEMPEAEVERDHRLLADIAVSRGLLARGTRPGHVVLPEQPERHVIDYNRGGIFRSSIFD